MSDTLINGGPPEGQRLRKLPAQGAVLEVPPARASPVAAEADRGKGN
jgi:hypothetical protein